MLSVELPDTITTLEAKAFYYCRSLTSIDLPSSLTSIGERCFYYCLGFTSIEIPDGVISIGDYCFSYCQNLTSIDIPDGITNIGNNCFYRCTGLMSVNMPDTVVSLGANCFDGCTALNTVRMSNSLISIGNSSFAGCTSLTSIQIPDSVTTLGNSCFSNTGLVSLEVPGSVTTFGNGCFSSPNLTSVVIAEGITSLPSGCFAHCASLISVDLPDSLISIGNGCFDSCLSLEYITIPNNVETIGEDAFNECRNLISIEIPDSVTYLGEYAFHDCINLEYVKLSNSMTTIERGTFYACMKLRYIEIPSSVKEIKEFAFYMYYGLGVESQVVFNEGLEVIGRYAFWWMQCDFDLPKSIKEIGFSAFYENRVVESVIIPSNCLKVGGTAFYGCSNLKTFILEEGENEIIWENEALCDYPKVVNGVWTDGICLDYLEINRDMLITSGSFNIMGIDTLVLNAGRLADRAFYGGWGYKYGLNIENIIIGDNFTGTISTQAFHGHCFLKSVSLGKNITAIEDYAFYYSYNDGVPALGSGAYEDVYVSEFNRIIIPESVESIGKKSFAWCNVLKTVIFMHDTNFTHLTTDTDIEESSFYESPNIETVYVKKGRKQDMLDNYVPIHFTNVSPNFQVKEFPYVIYDVYDPYTDTTENGEESIYYNVTDWDLELNGISDKNGEPLELKWYTDDNYTTPYTIGELPITNIEEPVYLYARYEPLTYDITYHNLNDAENPNPTVYTYGTGLTLEAPGERTGYDFIGWYDSVSNGNQVTAISNTDSGNKELWAVWDNSIYNITYHNLNDAENTNPAVYTYGTGLTLAAPGERTGYDFIGWYDAASDGNQVTAISNTDSGNKELWAVWEADEEDSTGNTTDNNGNPDENTNENTNENTGGGNNIIDPVPTPKEPPKIYPNIDTAPDDDNTEYAPEYILDDEVSESILPDDNNIPESDILEDEIPENTLDDEYIIPEADNPKTGNSYFIVILSAFVTFICLYVIKKSFYKKNSPVGNSPEIK